MQPLVSGEEFAEYPGSPYPAPLVDAAAEQIRDACGWHIAPQVTETLTLDSWGGPVLALPSLRVVNITAIRDVTSDTPKTLDRWRVTQNGLVVRTGTWPYGTIEVDIIHGYEECPMALLPLIAERAQRLTRDRSVRQESLGSRSLSYGVDPESRSDVVLARYTVPKAP